MSLSSPHKCSCADVWGPRGGSPSVSVFVHVVDGEGAAPRRVSVDVADLEGKKRKKKQSTTGSTPFHIPPDAHNTRLANSARQNSHHYYFPCTTPHTRLGLSYCTASSAPEKGFFRRKVRHLHACVFLLTLRRDASYWCLVLLFFYGLRINPRLSINPKLPGVCP